MGDEQPTLDAALALHSRDEVLKLYGDWAATYDIGWAAAMEFLLPGLVAQAFLDAGGTGPVLDVGAGTGLLGKALSDRGFGGEIDAIDLTPEMLEQARAKGVYSRLVTADVTLPLPVSGPYQGIVSSGMFTLGHVGPEALQHLLEVAAPGALFMLAINPVHFRDAGFDGVLASFATGISEVQRQDVPLYGAAAAEKDPGHAKDRTQIVRFHKR